jgi:hypothetical protein
MLPLIGFSDYCGARKRFFGKLIPSKQINYTSVNRSSPPCFWLSECSMKYSPPQRSKNQP